MKNTINIFSETGCISHEVLWKYRQGTLTASQKHAVEVHLTDCELCSDALAGMMAMESDEMMAGLRKSVRNISSPKKVIRFYDYRVLTAAAAVVAVVFVFAYMINSSDKSDKKQIAQLTVPPEPKKDKEPVVVIPPQTSLEITSTLSAANQSKHNNEKAIVTHKGSSPSKLAENNATVADADKQEETIVSKDVTTEDAVTATETEPEYAAPVETQTATGASNNY